MLPCQRHLFEIPADVAYFNCAYMSPQLKRVTAAGVEAMGSKARPWEVTPTDFFTTTEAARALCGALIGTGADDIAVVPSVSYGVGVAAANLPVPVGSRILVLEDQFPSNVYPWRAVARARSAEVRTVPRPADGDWTAAVMEHLDDRVAVAALPHCHWTDGGLVDLARVSRRCRELGAALCLDLTQSLGALPFSVGDVEPDFAVAADYKWLLGPYSVGFLYVHPKHHTGAPLEHNWINRRDSEDFARLVHYRDEFQPGARRYDVGERSNFALLPMAVAALEQLREWGVPAIQRTLAATTARIARGAGKLGLTVAPAPLRAGHLLGLRFPAGIPNGLPERLARERVYVSVRGDSIRVAPHLYNDAADVERLLATLAAAV
ncbi:MAG TPA: aminotransferase class V-fold PLP-dependent enzyme [Deferrisomatales bacterium]|nr:aminotransferase class V-fold PLP-dependent enzyme [Deferrisomatales bacterium]